MSAVQLPDELVVKILSYIPPSVLGVKFFTLESVCRQWNRLITTGQAHSKIVDLRIVVLGQGLDVHIADANFKPLGAKINSNIEKLLPKLLPRDANRLKLYDAKSEVLKRLSSALTVGRSYMSSLHIDGKADYLSSMLLLVPDALELSIAHQGHTLQSITGPLLENIILLVADQLLRECPVMTDLHVHLSDVYPGYLTNQQTRLKIRQLCALLQKHKHTWRNLRLKISQATPPAILKVLSALPEKTGNEDHDCVTHVFVDSKQMDEYFYEAVMDDQLKAALTRIDQLDIKMCFQDQSAQEMFIAWAQLPNNGAGQPDEVPDQIIEAQKQTNRTITNQFQAVCKQATNLKRLNVKFDKSLTDFHVTVSSLIANLCQGLHQSTKGKVQMNIQCPIHLKRDLPRIIGIVRNVATLCYSGLKRSHEHKLACEMSVKSDQASAGPNTKVSFVFDASDAERKYEIVKMINDYLQKEL